MMMLGKIKGETAIEVRKFFKHETGAGDPVWSSKGKSHGITIGIDYSIINDKEWNA